MKRDPMRVTDFCILRAVVSLNPKGVPLERRPRRVATLIRADIFERTRIAYHMRTVLCEDEMHDWKWEEGRLYFYSENADVTDVLVIYAEDPYEGPWPPHEVIHS